ncbi:Cation-independent mannose-6-phosphate receptor CI-MPR [Coemansia sp. IMI 209127]|nr:Cation-independent mannose-6-phosphate receptor CI-MPR [Coemansia sp. IMI 209127]
MMRCGLHTRPFFLLCTHVLFLLSLLLRQPVLALQSTTADSSDCTIRNASGQIEYDLRPLQLQGGSYVVNGFGSGYSFELNICRSLPGSSNETVAARWRAGEAKGTLGQTDDRLRLQGENVILEYSGGEVCANNSQKRQSAQVIFACDNGVTGLGSPEFLADWEQCAFVFLWRTPAACKVAIDNDNKAADNDIAADDDEPKDNPTGDNDAQGTSRGAVVFVAVFVFGTIYMLGGFLYNRVLNMSSGLRGIEQLPNYIFWRAIYLFGKRIVVGVASGTMYVVDLARGRRRGLIRIDSAELNMRSEIFDSENEFPDDDDDDNASYGDNRALTRA